MSKTVSVKEYFRWLFSLGPKPVQLAAADFPRAHDNQDRDVRTNYSDIRLKYNIVMIVTCSIVLLLVASFIVIVVYSILYPEKQFPIIFRDLIMGALGYLGGAFAVYYRSHT